jgi:hypothetical protein
MIVYFTWLNLECHVRLQDVARTVPWNSPTFELATRPTHPHSFPYSTSRSSRPSSTKVSPGNSVMYPLIRLELLIINTGNSFNLIPIICESQLLTRPDNMIETHVPIPRLLLRYLIRLKGQHVHKLLCTRNHQLPRIFIHRHPIRQQLLRHPNHRFYQISKFPFWRFEYV